MAVLNVNARGDGAWPDLQAKMQAGQVIWLRDETPISLTALAAGTEGGKPSVALRLDLPDGRTVVVETTLALWLTAADILRTAHGDPRT